MKILIVGPGEFLEKSKDSPIVGREYNLEDATKGTQAQNNTFHLLLQIYYSSRAWSYEGSGYALGATYTEFRDLVKERLGAGFSILYYVDPNESEIIIHEVIQKMDIPSHIPSKYIRGVLKSWADYTKREREKTIDNLIAEMHETGVRDKRFYDILEAISG